MGKYATGYKSKQEIHMCIHFRNLNSVHFGESFSSNLRFCGIQTAIVLTNNIYLKFRNNQKHIHKRLKLIFHHFIFLCFKQFYKPFGTVSLVIEILNFVNKVMHQNRNRSSKKKNTSYSNYIKINSHILSADCIPGTNSTFTCIISFYPQHKFEISEI